MGCLCSDPRPYLVESRHLNDTRVTSMGATSSSGGKGWGGARLSILPGGINVPRGGVLHTWVRAGPLWLPGTYTGPLGLGHLHEIQTI